MTNKEKFIEVFGEEPQRQYAEKSWLEQEYVSPITVNLEILVGAESEDMVPNKEEEDDCTDIYCEKCRNNYNCIEYLEEQERMNEEDDA